MSVSHEAQVKKVKLVLVGDMNVGKTCLAVRFAKNLYDETYRSTVGASFLAKAVQTPDTTIVFHIWDTAGQERFHSLIPMYLRDAKAAIVLYDITDEDSFENIKKIWMQKIRRDGPENMKMAIVGNKCDLTTERKVKTNTGKEFADWHHCMFMETSAKTGENVDELFLNIANCLCSDVEDSTTSSQIRLSDDVTTRRRKCCRPL